MKQFLFKCGLFAFPLIAVFSPAIIHLETYHELVPIEAMAKRNQHEGTLIGLAYSDPMHLVKQAVLKERQPKVIALGSSRVLPFRDLIFSEPKAFYNCGRSIGKVQDLAAFLSAYPGEKPKVIILGLDQDFFNWDEGDADKEPRSYQYKDTTYGSRATKGAKAVFEAWSDGEIETGNPTAETSDFIGRNARLHHEGYRADGSYLYGRLLQSEESPDAYEFTGTIRRIDKGKGRFATADHVSQEAVQIVANFLKDCREMNIHIIGFLPPYAGKVYDRFKQDAESHPHVFTLYESLKPLFEAEERLLMDFSDIRSLDANKFETTDGFHGSEVSYLKLLKQLAIHDRVLNSHINKEVLYHYLDHSFSARQIIEELPEADPRTPQSINHYTADD